MKKTFLLAFLIISGIFIAHSVFAITVNIPYNPALQPFTGRAGDLNLLPGYIVRIYQFAMAIAGLLAFSMIVAGGIYYSISAGSADKQREGKDMIVSALWGVLLLFGSFIILQTINPTLTTLKEPALPEGDPSAVIITSTTDSYKKCFASGIVSANENFSCGSTPGPECIDTLNEKFRMYTNECNNRYPGGGGYVYTVNDVLQKPKCHPFYKQPYDEDNKIVYDVSADASSYEWRKGTWAFCGAAGF